MSPKFALAILLFSCVLLGIANAQQHRYPQQRQQQRFQQRVGYNQQKVGTRNMDGGAAPPNLPPPEVGLPPSDGGAFNPDCLPNQLASGNVDNKRPRQRH